jgi:hypothetical protein
VQRTACSWLYQQAKERANIFFEVIQEVCDHVRNHAGESLWLQAMSSWPTGDTGRPNCLSVQILVTELLVGKKKLNKPYPIAKNAEEAFCSDYTPEECNATVDGIESKVIELLSQSFGPLESFSWTSIRWHSRAP